jgi:hypothetical protein
MLACRAPLCGRGRMAPPPATRRGFMVLAVSLLNGHTEVMTDAAPLLVVDAANVVGSTPDGWWRDRTGATERLRDRIAALAESGQRIWTEEPPEWVMVVEGKARGVTGTDSIRVVSAPGSGDDAIVDLIRAEGVDRRCAVVTADRGLRTRVTALGAEVLGPRTVRP